MTNETKIVEIGVEEDVDLGLGFEDFFLRFSIWCYREELVYCSKLWKWATSLANSTWVICQGKPSSMRILIVSGL